MTAKPSAHKKRLVNLIDGRTHNWTYGEGAGTASKGDAFAVEVVPLYEHPAADADPIYQLADDGKWYDVEKHIYEENLQAGYQGRIVYSGPATNTTIADMMEGMQVSVDVSTCDADAGNRYFGTVTEISELDGAKNGYILLVQDAEPNFTRAAPATDLAELVPDELTWSYHDNITQGEVSSWNDCRAATLRNIERSK